MRLFVAVDLSGETRDAIAAEQARIARALGSSAASLKWARPEQAHLTLVFLGQVDDHRVPGLADAIGRDIERAPFDIAFSGLGMFPPRGAPRVLWIGVSEGAPHLHVLQRELVARTVAQGVLVEAREFHPHITLARWPTSRPADRGRFAADPSHVIGRQRVDAATLYRSRLSPAGAVYSAEARANLTGG